MPRTDEVDRWMEREGLTAARIAAAIGMEPTESSRVIVQRWLSGQTHPVKFYRREILRVYGTRCPLLG